MKHETMPNQTRTLKILGTLGVIGAPMLLIEFIIRALGYASETNNVKILGVLETLYLGGWICSAVAMRMLRAMGRGKLSASLTVIQIMMLMLALGFTLHDVIRPQADAETLFLNIADAAWPLSHIFMLVVFARVRTAGVWQDWRKFAPLVCGLALPSFFVAKPLFNSVRHDFWVKKKTSCQLPG